MKLSNQALGAVMMALQKSLLEQSDIVPTLQEFQFQVDENECLIVINPPNFEIPGIGTENDANESPDENAFEDENTVTTGSD